MSIRTPALRRSLLAACASLALASFSAQAQITAAQADTAAIDRQPDSLPATVVTASGFKENAATQTQGVGVITAQDIAQSGARSVTEALQRVLGLLPMKLDLSGTAARAGFAAYEVGFVRHWQCGHRFTRLGRRSLEQPGRHR